MELQEAIEIVTKALLENNWWEVANDLAAILWHWVQATVGKTIQTKSSELRNMNEALEMKINRLIEISQNPQSRILFGIYWKIRINSVHNGDSFHGFQIEKQWIWPIKVIRRQWLSKDTGYDLVSSFGWETWMHHNMEYQYWRLTKKPFVLSDDLNITVFQVVVNPHPTLSPDRRWWCLVEYGIIYDKHSFTEEDLALLKEISLSVENEGYNWIGHDILLWVLKKIDPESAQYIKDCEDSYN